MRNERNELTRMESPFKKFRAKKMNCTRTRPVLGLLWAAALALPAFAAQAGVVFTNLYSFTNGVDGKCPAAGLVQGSDGNFYGTTQGDGLYHSGTVFKLTTNGELTTLHAFGEVTDSLGHPLDGWFPYGTLIQASDGLFYGVTSAGGAYDAGVVFSISTNGAFTGLYSFTGAMTAAVL
jgi:uncharacterized repeat protein (TIGR03803 family)